MASSLKRFFFCWIVHSSLVLLVYIYKKHDQRQPFNFVNDQKYSYICIFILAKQIIITKLFDHSLNQCLSQILKEDFCKMTGGCWKSFFAQNSQFSCIFLQFIWILRISNITSLYNSTVRNLHSSLLPLSVYFTQSNKNHHISPPSSWHYVLLPFVVPQVLFCTKLLIVICTVCFFLVLCPPLFRT